MFGREFPHVRANYFRGQPLDAEVVKLLRGGRCERKHIDGPERLQFQVTFFDSIENGASWNGGILPGRDGNGIFPGQTGIVDHWRFGESHRPEHFCPIMAFALVSVSRMPRELACKLSAAAL